MNRASGEVLTIPKSMVIRRLQNFRVPVATANTPLDPTMRYEDCVWIDHYKPEFTLAGGINLPKICVCFGSDGESYKQLVSRLFVIYLFINLFIPINREKFVRKLRKGMEECSGPSDTTSKPLSTALGRDRGNASRLGALRHRPARVSSRPALRSLRHPLTRRHPSPLWRPALPAPNPRCATWRPRQYCG